MGEQERAPAHPRRGQRGLGPRVPAADHNHLEAFRKQHVFKR
jgi:hypothetical protein